MKISNSGDASCRINLPVMPTFKIATGCHQRSGNWDPGSIWRHSSFVECYQRTNLSLLLRHLQSWECITYFSDTLVVTFEPFPKEITLLFGPANICNRLTATASAKENCDIYRHIKKKKKSVKFVSFQISEMRGLKA